MKHTTYHYIKQVLTYFSNFRWNIITTTVYSILSTLLDILPEILIGLAVDIVVYRESSFLSHFGVTSTLHQFMVLGAITAIVWILEAIFEYAHAYGWRHVAQKIQHQLRIDTYQHLQNADINFFDNAKSGNLVSILNDDINQLERFFDNSLHLVIHMITSVLVVGAIFFYISPMVAFMTLLPMPFICMLVFYFQKKLGPEYDNVRAKAGELCNRFMNNMHGITTIKSYAAERFELKRLINHSKEYQNVNARAIKLSAALTPMTRLLIMFGFISSLLYGGYLCLNKELAISTFTVLVFLSQRLLWPITYLGEIADLFYRTMASVRRIFDMMNIPISIKSGKLTPKSNEIEGELQFDGLSFAYDNKPIIHNLSLHIPAYSKIAFVGGTGTGKSTIVRLLLRFYDPTHGNILLDGRNLKEFHLEALRRNIGYVSQDVFLFNGTIAENIAYGSFNASIQEIEECAKIAEAHHFISRLPNGYQTKIGERGVKLSGGQKQRLSLARAILKNPPILILDEATSAIDNRTEAAIQRSLEQILADRTTIMIAHRLNTVRTADKIYVMENGKIIEQGNHQSLIDQHGAYAGLWQLQTGAA